MKNRVLLAFFTLLVLSAVIVLFIHDRGYKTSQLTPPVNSLKVTIDDDNVSTVNIKVDNLIPQANAVAQIEINKKVYELLTERKEFWAAANPTRMIVSSKIVDDPVKPDLVNSLVIHYEKHTNP